MDWFDLLAGQGTLKNLLQDHSSKASVLRQSAFFSVQFSHPYITTGKILALTRGTFVVNLLLILYFFLATLRSMWNFSSLTRDQTSAPELEAQNLKHWTAREFPPQFSSVAQSCPTLCDPMDCSTPGFPIHHQLPELPQTHVHRVGDAIQPSHPLSSPSPPAFNLSQYQGLFE